MMYRRIFTKQFFKSQADFIEYPASTMILIFYVLHLFVHHALVCKCNLLIFFNMVLIFCLLIRENFRFLTCNFFENIIYQEETIIRSNLKVNRTKIIEIKEVQIFCFFSFFFNLSIRGLALLRSHISLILIFHFLCMQRIYNFSKLIPK